MLLSETHVVLLIKDKQCTDIHPNRPRSHQSICALLTKPTATFGAGRHSPNVQLHVTPVVVLLVIIIVFLLLLDNYTARSTGRHSAHQLVRQLLSSASSSLLVGLGEEGGGVVLEGS